MKGVFLLANHINLGKRSLIGVVFVIHKFQVGIDIFLKRFQYSYIKILIIPILTT